MATLNLSSSHFPPAFRSPLLSFPLDFPLLENISYVALLQPQTFFIRTRTVSVFCYFSFFCLLVSVNCFNFRRWNASQREIQGSQCTRRCLWWWPHTVLRVQPTLSLLVASDKMRCWKEARASVKEKYLPTYPEEEEEEERRGRNSTVLGTQRFNNIWNIAPST